MATKPSVRAVFSETEREEARQPDTPMVGAGSLIAHQRDPETGKRELIEAVAVRTFYALRGSGMQPVRACVWIKAPRGSGKGWRSGRGSAGGCGYHKESAAIAKAVSLAGVTLYGDPYRRESDLKKVLDFGGTGSSAYREIFEAIACAAGFSGPFLWVSHGL
jgi:hypothetical protein